jgi:hypothetical protein
MAQTNHSAPNALANSTRATARQERQTAARRENQTAAGQQAGRGSRRI